MTTRLARRRGFSCTHRYEVKSWSADANRDAFGACFTPNGHGHNYELEVYLEAPVDRETGMILNLADVDQVLGELIKPLDGKNLNFEVPAFKDKVPTTEAVAEYLFKGAQARFDRGSVRVCKLRLYEYEDLWVDVWP